MDAKPNKILKLQRQLNVPFTLFTKQFGFPSSMHDVGYRLDEDGEVIGLYFGIGLPKLLNLDFLSDFTALQDLLITENYISDLSPIKALTTLISLELRNTGLEDLSPLSSLRQLRYLDLNLNKITNLEPLTELIELRHLNIGKNRVSDLEPLRGLEKIAWLTISNNSIKDLSAILALPALTRVELYNNPNINIDYPPEVVRGGWSALKAYSKNASNLVIYRNVKVLLLGNSTIGKSSLLKHLEHGKLVECESTHGVVYNRLVFNDITYNFWDFGGQEFFHATHRLFFSQNALNIVLWRDNVNTIANDNLPLDYWVRTVQQLNKDHDSQILLIENKTDLNSPKYKTSPLNQRELEDKYPNMHFNYEATSLADDHRVDVLKLTLNSLSTQLISNFKYPGFYRVFKDRIDASNKSVVSRDEINNRPGKENVNEALKLFHNMGFLLYFPEVMPDKVFARPEELLDLIYNRVLSDERKYRLTIRQIEDSIRGNSLDLTATELIKLLKYFDLIFEINAEKNVFFIPQYLPKISSWIKLFEKTTFLPISVGINADNYLMNLAMQKIFARYGTFVSKANQDYIFWNDGIIIEKDGSMLMIKFTRKHQRIELYRGQKDESYNLVKEIVDFILDLPEHPDMPKRNFGNHCIKRFRDAADEDKEWFSPNFMEYLSEASDREFQSSMEIGYSSEIDWLSDYFTVGVSLDGEYFIDWKNLAENKDLSDIKIYNDSGFSKIEKIDRFAAFLNMPKHSKAEPEKILDKKPLASTTINYNFNARVTAGAIGSGKTVNKPLMSASETNVGNDMKKDEVKNSLEYVKEKQALRRWKATAVVILGIYLFVALCYIVIMHYEFGSITSKTNWMIYKKSFIFEFIKWSYPLIGVVLVYKLGYDRLLDPSKEKAFIDLYKSRNK